MPVAPRLVDDAAIFPPGDAPLHEATAAYAARSAEDGADLVGTFVAQGHRPAAGARLRRPAVGRGHRRRRPAGRPGRARARKLGLDLAGLEIALRDLDDLAGNVRRVVAALDAPATRALDDECPVYVELPHVGNTASLARGRRRGGRGRAAAEVPHRRAGGARRSRPPTRSRAGSTPRSTGRRRSSARPACTTPSATPATTASSTTASSTCWSPPGWPSTAPRVDDVVAVLEQRDGAALVADGRDARPRRRTPVVHVVRLLLGRRAVATCAAGAGSHVNAASGSTTCRTASSRSPASPRRVGVRIDDEDGAWSSTCTARPAGRSSPSRRSTRSWPSARRCGGRPATEVRGRSIEGGCEPHCPSRR